MYFVIVPTVLGNFTIESYECKEEEKDQVKEL